MIPKPSASVQINRGQASGLPGVLDDCWIFPEPGTANQNQMPIYVRIIESPKWFSLSKGTLYRAAKRGEISIYKAGNRTLVKITEIQEWIESSNRIA